MSLAWHSLFLLNFQSVSGSKGVDSLLFPPVTKAETQTEPETKTEHFVTWVQLELVEAKSQTVSVLVKS